MNLALCSLASGSSGNAYLVRTDSTALLVDAGISGKQISQRLWQLGLETKDLEAILLTHEHSDHVSGLKVLLKKNELKVIATGATIGALECAPAEETVRRITPGESFSVGNINVNSFPLSHDAADPTGFALESGGKRICIVTDTGIITPDCLKHMIKADILVLESNHDESMLRIGHYPWFLKQRILSDKGHLSNEAAANALLEVLKYESVSCTEQKKRTVLLAHLSKENNFPEMALATVSNILEAQGFGVGRSVTVTTLSRTEPSPLYVL